MPRYKLTLEYDGRDFVGWQRQDNGTAIQELVEDAIARFSGESATTASARCAIQRSIASPTRSTPLRKRSGRYAESS